MATKSTGRGGAGNIVPAEKTLANNTSTFETPTIKAEKYTTGRGGSGNIATNDKDRPELARAAQDVTGQVEGPESRGAPMHYGRGGAANIVPSEPKDKGKGKETDIEKAQGSIMEAKRSSENRGRSGSPSLLNMAKEGFERVRRASTNKKETK